MFSMENSTSSTHFHPSDEFFMPPIHILWPVSLFGSNDVNRKSFTSVDGIVARSAPYAWQWDLALLHVENKVSSYLKHNPLNIVHPSGQRGILRVIGPA